MVSTHLKNGVFGLQDTHVLYLGGHETTLYSYHENNTMLEVLDDQSLRYVLLVRTSLRLVSEGGPISKNTVVSLGAHRSNLWRVRGKYFDVLDILSPRREKILCKLTVFQNDDACLSSPF